MHRHHASLFAREPSSTFPASPLSVIRTSKLTFSFSLGTTTRQLLCYYLIRLMPTTDFPCIFVYIPLRSYSALLFHSPSVHVSRSSFISVPLFNVCTYICMYVYVYRYMLFSSSVPSCSTVFLTQRLLLTSVGWLTEWTDWLTDWLTDRLSVRPSVRPSVCLSDTLSVAPCRGSRQWQGVPSNTITTTGCDCLVGGAAAPSLIPYLTLFSLLVWLQLPIPPLVSTTTELGTPVVPPLRLPLSQHRGAALQSLHCHRCRRRRRCCCWWFLLKQGMAAQPLEGADASSRFLQAFWLCARATSTFARNARVCIAIGVASLRWSLRVSFSLLLRGIL